MSVTACLSWYNESPAMLTAAVTSLTFADHLVAVDGAYALYPDATASSPADQAATIREAASHLGIGCTIHQPQHAWEGNEVEKRSFMFRLAEATGADWYYIADADEQVTHVMTDIHADLDATDLDAAEVTYWWHRPHTTPEQRPFATPLREQQGITKFFRAIPGLHVHQAHYRYRTPDGRLLWNPAGQATEPLNLRETIRVQHRNTERDMWRAREQANYYTTRDTHNIEKQPVNA